MNRAAHDPRLVAALGPVAKSYLSQHVDPAAAWLAAQEGLFHKQARSRARNAARSLGTSWPDRLPIGALVDPAETPQIQHSWGLWGADPAQILEALESVQATIKKKDAAGKLRAADLREASTRAMSDVFKVTQRRAQQIKKAALLVEQAGQMELWEVQP